jgi:hypothetical protein
MIGALERRPNLFHTVELQAELEALKAQILALQAWTPPILKLVERWRSPQRPNVSSWPSCEHLLPLRPRPPPQSSRTRILIDAD